MKQPLPLVLIFITLFLLNSNSLFSGNNSRQLDPTIENAPDGPLCPFEEVSLTTQEYDSYQWYSRPGNGTSQPVSGATQRTFSFTPEPENFYYIRVKVTLDGEEAFSQEVLIDQRLFNPGISATGENIQQDIWGNIHACREDFRLTLFFNDSLEYTNPKWVRSGKPMEDATQYYHQVSESGYYQISASPVECPNLIVYSDQSFNIEIHDPEPPTITQQGDSLLADWNIGQWYFEQTPIDGAIYWVLVPEEEGYYTFEYTQNGCPATSEPFLFSMSTGISKNNNPPPKVVLSPNPATNKLTIHSHEPVNYIEIFDNSGKRIVEKEMSQSHVDISWMNSGIYYIHIFTNEGFSVKKFIKAN